MGWRAYCHDSPYFSLGCTGCCVSLLGSSLDTLFDQSLLVMSAVGIRKRHVYSFKIIF